LKRILYSIGRIFFPATESIFYIAGCPERVLTAGSLPGTGW